MDCKGKTYKSDIHCATNSRRGKKKHKNYLMGLHPRPFCLNCDPPWCNKQLPSSYEGNCHKQEEANPFTVVIILPWILMYWPLTPYFKVPFHPVVSSSHHIVTYFIEVTSPWKSMSNFPIHHRTVARHVFSKTSPCWPQLSRSCSMLINLKKTH